MSKFKLLIIGGAVAGFTVLYVLPTVIYMFVAQPYRMSGSSMYPNLKDGEYFLINKLDRDFEKEEVIVFKDSQEPNRDIIKRISGMPGELINIEGRTVSLDQDEYYVLGDNRDYSIDSRKFGPIKKSSIIGKYWFSYFKPK